VAFEFERLEAKNSRKAGLDKKSSSWSSEKTEGFVIISNL
jgi:hypothetical protein